MSKDNNFELPKLPEVKFNKSGFEIRTEILKQAQDLLAQEFSYKWQGWEMSQHRDKDGNIITKVDVPQFPGLEQVIDTAERMYAFVNNASKK